MVTFTKKSRELLKRTILRIPLQEIKDDNFQEYYLLITRNPEDTYTGNVIFKANYHLFQKQFIIEKDHEIIAGPYVADEGVVNKIIGYDSLGDQIGPHYLEDLVNRLNNYEEFDADLELRSLIDKFKFPVK